MRILAIRGQNLASLRTFDVPLAEGALGRVGLFAITGPTGAGKSTLLDALCLALYDKTPRLGERGRNVAEVGASDDLNRLKENDVRGLLRRGAGTGYAEVDFVGVDGVAYRARWSVHRARKRADGRLQDQKVDLHVIDDGRVLTAHRKTDTLKAIEARVGLSFDQFRRSVLLAQGEFDAFLKADGKQRGQLLERMTGTEIYGTLSKAAHARASEARATLGVLEQQIESHPVLDDAARVALDDAIFDGRDWVNAARTRREALAALVGWRDRKQRTEIAVAEAEAEADAARQALQAAEPRRTALAEARAAEPLRPAWEGWQRATRDAGEANARRMAREAEVVGAEEARAEQVASLEAAQLAREAARTEHTTLEPQLALARTLDRSLAQAAGTLRQARTKDESCQREAAEAAEALASAEAELEAAQAAETAARAWLDDHGIDRALAEQWPRWSDELAAMHAALDRAEAAMAGEAERIAAAHTAAEAHDAALAQHVEARKAEEAARQAFEALPGETEAARDLRARHAAVTSQIAQWRQLRDLVTRVRTLSNEVEGAKEQRASARAALRKAKAQAKRSSARQVERNQALIEAETGLRRVTAVVDLTTLRADLVEGAPCPLCGSTSHPGVTDAVAAVVDEQRQRVAHLRAEERAALKTATEAEARAEAAELRRDDAEQLLGSRQAALASGTTDWAMARLSVGAALPEDPLTDGVERDITRGIEASYAERDELDAQLQAARDQRERREAARAELDAALTATRAAGKAVERCRAADEAARTAQAGADRAIAEAERARQEAVTRLVEALGPERAWGPRMAADPEAFRADCARRAEVWLARNEALESARAAQAAVSGTLGSARTAARLSARTATEASAARQAAEKTHEGLVIDRAALFDGAPADAVQGASKARVEEAEQAYESARMARAKAREAHAAALGRFESAEAEYRSALAESEAAELRLADALGEAGLDADTLQQRLSRDPRALETEQAELDALVQAVTRTEAVFQQKQADLARLQASAPAALPPDLDAALTATQAAGEAFREAVAVLQARRAEDDRSIDARERLVPTLEAEAAAALTWRQLDELIGAADGGKFRQFAQSLTLEAVIEQANLHLLDLSPRYLLMRVPGQDLALQVIDRTMGDEIRGIPSLSGGESFLVSLALALGLASLSARDTRIESLFIDEGLGSLDVDTLDKVLDTLDALQATGRQVGLISHVPGLAERIGAQVKITPESAGVSRLDVYGVSSAAA